MDTSTPANLAYSIVLSGVRDTLTDLPVEAARPLQSSIAAGASRHVSELLPSQEDRANVERLVTEMLSSLERAVYVLPQQSQRSPETP